MSEIRENGKGEIGKEIKMRGGWNKEEKGNKQGKKMEEKWAVRKVSVRRGERERDKGERKKKKKEKKQSCPNFFTEFGSPRSKVGLLDESYE